MADPRRPVLRRWRRFCSRSALATSPLAGLVIAAFLAACTPSALEVKGPERRAPASRAVSGGEGSIGRLQARGLARPSFWIDPPDAIVGRYRNGVVAKAEKVEGRAQRLIIDLDRGSQVALEYSLPGGLPLPLEPGDVIRIRHYPPGEGAERLAWFLVIRDQEEQLLAAVFSGPNSRKAPGTRLIPSYELPRGLDIKTTREITYSEVRQLPNLCLARIEHQRIRVADSRHAQSIQPGTYVAVDLEERRFQFVAIDASRLVDESCAANDPTHLSFALLARRPTKASTEASAAPPGP